MIGFANAKINIGLHIVRKRDDGYHDIETVFYPVGLEDVVEVLPSRSFDLVESGFVTGVDYTQNLVFKAYKLLSDKYKISPVKVRLHKNIPFGAGLGGGSSDAATMLMLLNQLYQLGLDKKQLKSFASSLGADCAFFIENQPMIATGKGDVLRSVDLNLDNYRVVIVKPGLSVSTPQAYSLVKPVHHEVPLEELIKTNVEKWPELIENDFEKFLFDKYPVLKQTKDFLYSKGALYASMTGSGSAFFAIFPASFNDFDDFNFEFVWYNRQNNF